MENMLFVRNIAPTLDSSTLEDLFNSVGDVETVSIDAEFVSDKGLRIGYIQMRTAQGAQDCIERFNGLHKNGAMLIVTPNKPHQPDPNFSPKRRKNTPAKKKKS
jgi:RNA recognition motif-containing protein